MKKIKKIILSLLASIVVLTGFTACSHKANSSDESKDIKNIITNKETKKEKIKETKKETIKESIKETDKETKSEESDNSSPKPNKIKGKNHNQKFKDMAYDVEEIRELSYDGDYKGKKIAFLTFDDGPNNVITPHVLDVLKEKNVPATFFMVGHAIGDTTQDTLKRAYNEGHAIGTHSLTHDYETLYPGRVPDPDVVVSEEKQAIKLLKKYLGNEFESRVFRYPGGHMSWNRKGLKKSDKALAKLNIHWIDWNTMNGDAQPIHDPDLARPTTVDEVIKNFDKSKNFTANSDIAVILMHDAADKDLTLKALPSLIDHLKEQGYEFGILE
ncbi:polysaccharide deacetylase family protein [Helcococcus bovis]|uniref:polysaccharide deacetylase family protein n=1 Tax=Helcococcus bovis TaxID=3153252 RepID=UPI0038BB38B6